MANFDLDFVDCQSWKVKMWYLENINLNSFFLFDREFTLLKNKTTHTSAKIFQYKLTLYTS